LGASILLYGESTVDSAKDIRFRSSAVTTFWWDDSESIWTFIQPVNFDAAVTMDTTLGVTGNATFAAYMLFSHATDAAIYRSVNDAYMAVSGGAGTSAGGNVIFYGGTHGAAANDILFRSGSTQLLRWDDSDGRWEFGTAVTMASTLNVTGLITGLDLLLLDRDIYRDTDSDILRVSGGSSGTLGARLVLWGEDHATGAHDAAIYCSGVQKLAFDFSASLWTFADSVGISGALGVTGLLTTAATVAGGAKFHLPEGTVPDAPVNGNVWMTTAGLYYKAGGVVVGPLTGAP